MTCYFEKESKVGVAGGSGSSRSACSPLAESSLSVENDYCEKDEHLSDTDTDDADPEPGSTNCDNGGAPGRLGD